MILSFAEIARFTGGDAPLSESRIGQWSIDTRTMPAGAAYIALIGENHDGHAFLPMAAEKGALAAIVDQRNWPEFPGMHLFRVHDTLVALQELARHARGRIAFPLIGVTGSAGKTTTKETIATLLSARLRVAKNEGNFNNHIGVPLSILRLDEESQAGVLEMGMNHAGEIRMLAGIARPQIGVVTNVGTAHIENFDDIDGIKAAKRELVESLPADGVAVLNADDPRVRSMAEVHRGRTVFYGTAEDADVRAEQIALSPDGSSFVIEGVRFTIALPGRHGVLNVAAGVAVGRELGVPLADMAEAAATLLPAKMRGERMEHAGVTILNDCYNSNPEAAKSMIDTLAALPGNRKIAVLGEMRELGRWAEQFHREVGEHAADAGIDVVIGVTGAAQHIVEGARPGTESHFFADPGEAGAAVQRIARPGDVILFKGSRGTRVERALERFLAN